MYLHLIDLCLDTIADNFQRFNLVFTTTEDDNMKLMFEFLQRKYSFDLLGRLCVKDDVSEKYVDLLINKYLKVLDISWFRECSWDKVTSKIAEIGCNVEKIFIQDVYFEEFSEETPWQDIICHLPNLKFFTFHEDCHDLILKSVAKLCPNIEEINIVNSEITSEAIKYLCKNKNGKALCTKLKKIFIAGTHLKDDDVKYLLKNLPSLEMIDYPDLPLVLHSLHKNDLSSLDKVEPYNITTLDLMNLAQTPFFVDILKVCLAVCPHLKSFTCGLVNKDELNFFSNLSELEKLHIESFSDSEININNLLKSKGGKLTSLTVGKCTVSVSILAKTCPRVKELILNRVDFLFDEDLKPAFNSLSSCTFENASITTSARAISLLLLSSSKLESISFIRCSLLSPEIKTHILKCCELYPIKKISFCCSVIEKEYVKDLLLNCHSLNSLNIENCFDSDDEDELSKFAEILSNKPEIVIGNHLDISDYEEYLNGNYELDYEYDYENDYDYDYDYDYDDDDDSYDGDDMYY